MSKEAMKLALEALESCGAAHITDGGRQWYDEKLVDTAYAALREALAEQPSPPPECKTEAEKTAYAFGWFKALESVREKPAQQEPVAWLHTKIEGVAVPHRPADLDKHPDRWAALYKEPKPCPTCEALARTVMLDQTYHDNISPQRTWVGLTDEDLRKLADKHLFYQPESYEASGVFDLARAIEAAHGIKENT